MINNTKIFITGGKGFIGSYLYSSFIKRGFNVAAVDIRDGCKYTGDVSNMETIRSIIFDFRPDIVIHCSSDKGLEFCEEYKLKSFQNNVLSTENLVFLSKELGFKIIYLSSDVVFYGDTGNYDVTDLVNPINWYGKTKAFSEIILKNSPNFVVCRTSLVIGKLTPEYKKILLDEIKNKILVNQTLLPQYIYFRLKNNLPVFLPSLYISNPTPIELLFEFIQKIIESDQVGIFHTSGSLPISRVEFANIIANGFSFNKNLIKIDNSIISNLRPKNIGLKVEKTFSILNINQDQWKIDYYLSQKFLYE